MPIFVMESYHFDYPQLLVRLASAHGCIESLAGNANPTERVKWSLTMLYKLAVLVFIRPNWGTRGQWIDVSRR